MADTPDAEKSSGGAAKQTTGAENHPAVKKEELMEKPTYPAPTVEPPRRGFKPAPSDEGLIQLLDGCVAAGAGLITTKTYAAAHKLAMERGIIRDPDEEPMGWRDTALVLASMYFRHRNEEEGMSLETLYFSLVDGAYDDITGCSYDLDDGAKVIRLAAEALRWNGLDEHFMVDPDEIRAEMERHGDKDCCTLKARRDVWPDRVAAEPLTD